ncbi:vanadium-dependent haloperoxidase [Desulfococcus sp.]|uniref:vanadium-dependent haloperoxidase n=1 Tax=Desulfococcus sp. TaxID=2025834 RepID=UPI003593376F
MNTNKYFTYKFLLVFAVVVAFQPAASGAAFDFENGNAPVEVIIPRVIPAIFQSVSPTASDATLVLRITTLITNSWFDAIAPYHPTAVGVYSDLERQEAGQATNSNRNTAVLYASYRVLNSLLPNHKADWEGMLTSVGLDPDDDQENTTTAIGIGNLAGNAVVANREHDGMNQLGDEGGRTYNRVPYADYLGYQPVNTAYVLRNPSRWQPNIVSAGNGIFHVQQFVTPQLRVTMPYSFDNPNRFHAPVPTSSNVKHRKAYKQQADEVLAASAGLSDLQKMTAELFDNKLASLGFSALFASQTNGLSLEGFIQYDFLTNLAAFDTAIAVWNEKYRYDAVRPFSAIRYLYGNRPVTAWGGPGKGAVNDLPASEWRSYLNTADHPEYPSGSASFCAAHAQASRRFLGSDNLGWVVPRSKGSSVIEPGITPAGDIELEFDTWSTFEEECGLSRLRGGVHFMASIPAGQNLGRTIGDLAYAFITSHINGIAP